MTIGVVDECRRLGIGTLLLNETIEVIKMAYPKSCNVIYLHVVDYNKSAIKFYLKNGFEKFKRVQDHYLIMGEQFDAIVIFKDISKVNPTRRKEKVGTESNLMKILKFPFRLIGFL